MKNTIRISLVLSAVVATSLSTTVQAQNLTNKYFDSAYITTFPQKFIVRAIASQKYADFNMQSASAGKDVHYYANLKYSLGIGAAYRNLAASALFNVGYLNSDKEKIGKTKGLDAQFHFTPYKWQIDAIGSFRQGSYLKPKGFLSGSSDKYYFRPDMDLNLIGVGAYRVANARRYSTVAVLTQADWQTRSAGSFLFGGEAYYGWVKGDSSLIPAVAAATAAQKDVDKISFINVGPGIGYGYTLVIAKHIFIAASVIGNVDLNIVREEGGGQSKTETGIATSGVYKGAIGYNSASWSVSATMAGNLFLSKAVYSPKDYLYNIGEVRIALAKRFHLKRK